MQAPMNRAERRQLSKARPSGNANRRRLSPNLQRVANPVTQAMLRQKIDADVERLRVAANLHAHLGGNAAATLNLAGRLTYIVCHAAGKCGLGWSPEARILAGTANALAEVQACPEALEAQRQTILSGLAAIDRLMPKLHTLDLAEGAMRLEVLLASGDMGTGDVQEALEAVIS